MIEERRTDLHIVSVCKKNFNKTKKNGSQMRAI